MNIYVSVIYDDELELVRQNNMGYEITFYSSAKNLDTFETIHPIITQNMKGINKFSMHGSYDGVNYATNDPLIVEITKKRFMQSINVASFHGVKQLIFHSAYRTFFGFKEPATKYFIKTSIAFWADIAKNIPDGMTIFIENVEDEDPQVFVEIINGIDSPKIKCCFDIGHAFSYSPFSLDIWIKVLKDKIGYVHIHDNDGKSDLHLPLGKGNISFLETLYGIMEYTGDKIPFTLECNVPTSIDWLRKNNFL